MSVEPPNADADPYSAMERAVEAATLGHGHRLDRKTTRDLVDYVESYPDARVRIAARALTFGARAAWKRATRDADASVRRRAAELAPALDTLATHAPMVERLLALLADSDPLVAESAAFALGELGSRGSDRANAPEGAALARAAEAHSDALVREAAVAALGAIGDPRYVSSVLAATRDRPAIRRRAVLALAAFEGADVEAAIERALTDTDWQVRQAAEDLK